MRTENSESLLLLSNLENSKGTENSEAKPKAWVKRPVNVLLLVSVSLVTLFFVASLIWKFSGSNQWELFQEKNGVKVYSLKAPGLDVKQVKGVVRVHSTLAGIVKFMQDPDVCNDIGCYESKMIERVDDQLQYFSFQFHYPFPFRTREFVVRAQFYQNPHTKEVFLEYAAAPDKTPPNACCFRITDMNNTWRFTPLENGQVEIEYTVNMNDGGFVPDLLHNMKRPRVMFALLPRLQGLLNKEKYQSAKFDFIKEK